MGSKQNNRLPHAQEEDRQRLPLPNDNSRGTGVNSKWLWRVSELFDEWNMHQPKKLCRDLMQALNQGNHEEAKRLVKPLETYMLDFSRGDAEGQFYWGQWQALTKSIESTTIYTQTNLF